MKQKLITLLLLTSLFCATNRVHALNYKLKAGIGLAAAGAGAGVGLYFANHFYEKYKSINPKFSHPKLIKKRRQYLALALIFYAGGAAWLVGGGIYGIRQLRPDPPAPVMPRATSPEDKTPKKSEFQMWRDEIKRLVPEVEIESIADETLTQLMGNLEIEEKEDDKERENAAKQYLDKQENLGDFLKKLEDLERNRDKLFPRKNS
ncbi:hypothetical protein KAT92_04000 [Candidatus Babeliales bacterium]|nr:hypothetical protein [Candidatus Babeliales bacterium]